MPQAKQQITGQWKPDHFKQTGRRAGPVWGRQKGQTGNKCSRSDSSSTGLPVESGPLSRRFYSRAFEEDSPKTISRAVVPSWAPPLSLLNQNLQSWQEMGCLVHPAAPPPPTRDAGSTLVLHPRSHHRTTSDDLQLKARPCPWPADLIRPP